MDGVVLPVDGVAKVVLVGAKGELLMSGELVTSNGVWEIGGLPVPIVVVVDDKDELVVVDNDEEVESKSVVISKCVVWGIVNGVVVDAVVADVTVGTVVADTAEVSKGVGSSEDVTAGPVV